MTLNSRPFRAPSPGWRAQPAALLLLIGLAFLPGTARTASLDYLEVRPVGKVGPPAALQPGIATYRERWAQVRAFEREQLKSLLKSGANPGKALGARGPKPERVRFSQEEPETIRVACIRVNFKSDTSGGNGKNGTGEGKFQLDRDTVNFVDPGPHDRKYFEAHMEALDRFMRAQSYGTMVVRYDVYPRNDTAAYHLENLADYGPWNVTQGVAAQAVRFVHDALRVADRGADTIPWSKYDRVMIFHAGPDFQSDIHQDTPYDIPTFTLFMFPPSCDTRDTTMAVVHDRTNGRTVEWDAAAVLPETSNQDGLISGIQGGVAHEFGLLLGSRGRLGVPDLYNIFTISPVLGYWSLMDSGNLLGTRLAKNGEEVYAIGILPGPHDIWSKRELFPDAMIPLEVTGADSTITLGASVAHSEYGMMRLNQDEFLLLENRQGEVDTTLGPLVLQTDSTTGVILGTARLHRTATDSVLIPTPEYDYLQLANGILCLHVDSSVAAYYGVNAAPYFAPNSRAHRAGIGVTQADGSGSIGDGGSPYFNAGPFDTFFRGQIRSGLPEDGIPSTRGNSGGSTHTSFDVLDPNQELMRVRMRRSRAIANWPRVEGVYGEAGFQPGTAAAADLDGDGVPEYYAVEQHAEITQFCDGDTLRGHIRAAGSIRGRKRNGSIAGRAGTQLPLFAPAPGRWVLPDLLPMPEWGARGADALVAVWYDSTTSEGSIHRLISLGSGGAMRPGFPARLPSVTTPPVRYLNKVLVGAADGRVWLVSEGGGVEALGDSTGIPVLGRLCVGPFGLGGSPEVASALANGSIGRASLIGADLSGASSARPQTHPVSVTPVCPPGCRWTRPVLLGGATRVSGDTIDPLLIAVDSTGWVCAWTAHGVVLPGFPFQLNTTVANIATMADLSDDGRPSIVLLGADQRVYAIGMDGRPLPGYPARIPTGNAPVPGCAILQLRDGAGNPILLVPTTGGDLVGLDRRGRQLPEWRTALHAGWGTGAFFVPGDGARNVWLLSLGSYGGWCLDSLPGISRSQLVSWGPGVDENRTGFLSPTRMAPARAGESYAQLGDLRVYPSPLRLEQQSEFRVSFTLSAGATIRLRLYDLTGRVVAERVWQGHLAGNVVAIPASNLGTGLYQCEVQLMDGSRRERRAVAIIR